MNKILAIINKASDGTFSVSCVDEMFSGVGDTEQEAKDDMMAQMKFFKETAIEDGFAYPDFMDQDYEIIYKSDDGKRRKTL